MHRRRAGACWIVLLLAGCTGIIDGGPVADDAGDDGAADGAGAPDDAGGPPVEEDPDAGIEEEPGGTLNLLPWKPGKRFRVNQAHGGFSHNDTSYWAWDFDLPVGSAVLAAHNGVVRLARGDSHSGCCDRSCGPKANYVILEKGDGTESAYLHLSEVFVKKGDVVTRGQRIGRSGETGYVCGAHLHFQMQRVPDDRTSRYSQSVHSFFHDRGADEPFDPQVGAHPMSRNGTLDVP